MPPIPLNYYIELHPLYYNIMMYKTEIIWYFHQFSSRGSLLHTIHHSWGGCHSRVLRCKFCSRCQSLFLSQLSTPVNFFNLIFFSSFIEISLTCPDPAARALAFCSSMFARVLLISDSFWYLLYLKPQIQLQKISLMTMIIAM